MSSIKNKTKYRKNLFVASLTMVLVIVAGIILTAKPASAATTIPLCQPPSVGSGNGAASSCFDSQGNSFYPVGDNKDKNPNPEDGHCYTTRYINGFKAFIYFNADCKKLPFSATKVISCNDGTQVIGDASTDAANSCTNHGGVKGSQIPLQIDCNAAVLTKDNCGIIWYLQLFINVLSGLVGVTVVIVLIVAGIQYSSAGNNPQQLSAAKGRIFNALLALLVFIFMYAFLQWIVPGGIF